MFLHAIATATPESSFTQRQCWEVFKNSPTRERLDSKSVGLIEKVLLGDSGIERRYFSLSGMPDLFELSAGELNRAFEEEAPALAAQALQPALERAGWSADSLDGLFICTCTGYLCPGISSHVAERLGLPAHAVLQDLVGLGCGAAIPTLRSAHYMARGETKSPLRIAVIAVEICSAAFFLEDDPGVLISACIFSDGAAATLWSNQPGPTGLQTGGFDTLHVPKDREILRFLNSDGKLKNRLHRSVPGRAACAVETLYNRRHKPDGHSAIIAHSGGRDVLDALEKRFPGEDLGPSREVLRRYGNMSSPSVLFALEAYLDQNPDLPSGVDDLWLVSFGAGFSAHSCRLFK